MAGLLGRAAELIRRHPFVVLGGPVIYVGAVVIGNRTFLRSARTQRRQEELVSSAEQIDATKCDPERFSTIATRYDEDIDWEERVMWIPFLRRRLLRKAHGDVLEVSCGTGRNIPYYPGGVSSLTMVDNSDGMVAMARYKLGAEQPSSSSSSTTTTRYEVSLANAEQLPYPDNSFDTVVDTFGLCSTENPVRALKEMQRVCKPGGKVLLLEHGRGTWGLLNWWLDRTAAKHCATWGCWYNRDIGALLAASGLRVEQRSRWHFGAWLLRLCCLPHGAEFLLPALVGGSMCLAHTIELGCIMAFAGSTYFVIARPGSDVKVRGAVEASERV